MAEELEKTCENCKYEFEDFEGTHCRHCIHNAEEHFEPKEKETSETEIRNKAIDEFAKELIKYAHGRRACIEILLSEFKEIAEQMKGGEE